jgi:hypothetical protein
MTGPTATRAGSFAWLASSSSLGGSAGYAAAGLLIAHATITATILIGAALPIAAATAVPQRTRRPAKPHGQVQRDSRPHRPRTRRLKSQ